MAYVKPGVEITQKQETVSPTLISPDLYAAILGPSYRVMEIVESRETNFSHDYGTILATGVPTSINLYSGVSFDTGTLTTIDPDSVYVDIIGKKSQVQGQTLHIPPSHGSLSLNGNTLSINKSLLSGITSVPDYWVSGAVRVGWRAMASGNIGQVISIESVNDVESFLGKVTPANPLGFGTYQALANANRKCYAVPMGSYEDSAHTSALELVGGLEVYAISPLDLLTTSQATTYGTHCTNRSAATEKMERIALACVEPSITGVPGTDASTIAGQSASLVNKRLVNVQPVMAYVSARVHVSTLHPDYVREVIWAGTSYTPKAKLNQRVQVGSKLVYFAGQEIDGYVWSGMAVNPNNSTTVQNVSFVDALIPVPGYYWAASVAGQVAGNPPQQGHTNLPIAGSLAKVRYSNDYFTQTQLNEIATGGTYIIHQNSANAVPTCRHQLSTDMSSIETRELSITKVVDYTSKLLRSSLSSYIGRFNITPQFLKVVSMIIAGVKQRLLDEGVVIDLLLNSIEQSSTERDTVLVNVEISVPYPVNYIKITLAF